jgi:hypothetical protein
MCACIPIARVLLAAGADPNWADADGDTVLHHVLASSMVVDPAPFIACLLDAGADPHRANLRGVSPLDDAIAREGEIATTYFPKRPLGAKQLAASIELLRGHGQGQGQGSTVGGA